MTLALYKDLWSRLGLSLAEDDNRVVGVLNGVSVNLNFTMDAELLYSAFIPRPARVQFSIAERSLIDKATDLFRGYHPGNTGFADFDERFSTQAGDSVHVARLLTPAARKELIKVFEGGLHPMVTAQIVSLHRFAFGQGAAVLEYDFGELTKLAHLLSQSFALAR